MSEIKVGVVWRGSFCFEWVKTTSSDKLTRSTCFINGIPLTCIIDTCAIYMFVSLDCTERLGLKLSYMVGSMIVDTPTLGLLTTSWVCLNCLLTIYGKSFGLDLVCLPLNKIGVILRMNWLEFNHVHINCFDKSVSFPKFDASDKLFVLAKQVDEFMKDKTEVFLILAFVKVESKVVIIELPVLCKFPEVLPYDISDLLPEHEVEFLIELVSGNSPVSMAPYKVSSSKLS